MIPCPASEGPHRSTIGLRIDEEIEVWCASLDPPSAVLEGCARILSRDEANRAQLFRFDRHRRRFVAGRGFLRMLLAPRLGVPAVAVRFAYGPKGKPSLAEGLAESGLRFSLAHSQEVALCAVAVGRDVGVDVEVLRPVSDADQIAARFFSPAENAALLQVAAEERLVAFFDCWTRKEAYLKALGDGLSRPLDSFDVTLGPGEPARLLRVADRPEEAARWSLRDLRLSPGYVGALAVEGPECRLALRNWNWPATVTPGTRGEGSRGE